jgi:hypothetical protein
LPSPPAGLLRRSRWLRLLKRRKAARKAIAAPMIAVAIAMPATAPGDTPSFPPPALLLGELVIPAVATGAGAPPFTSPVLGKADVVGVTNVSGAVVEGPCVACDGLGSNGSSGRAGLEVWMPGSVRDKGKPGGMVFVSQTSIRSPVSGSGSRSQCVLRAISLACRLIMTINRRQMKTRRSKEVRDADKAPLAPWLRHFGAERRTCGSDVRVRLRLCRGELIRGCEVDALLFAYTCPSRADYREVLLEAVSRTR